MSRTTKKVIALLLAVLMVTTLVSPSSFSWSSASEARGSDIYASMSDATAVLSEVGAVVGNLEDYITGATIADGENNIYGSSKPGAVTKLPVDPSDPNKPAVSIQMAMDIVFPEDIVNQIVSSQQDAVFTYQMPDAIKFHENIIDKDINDGTGNKIGKYSVIDGVLTATIFYESVEGGAELNAYFQAWIDMDLSKYNDKNEVENRFSSSVVVTVPVDFKPDVDVQKTASEGHVTDPMDGYIYFDYTVSVTSPHGTDGKDITFTDVVSNNIDGVSSILSDIKVTAPDGSDATSLITYDSASGSMSGTLPQMKSRESYSITYTVKSKIDDLGQDVVELTQNNIAKAYNEDISDTDQTNKYYKYVDDNATDISVKKSNSDRKAYEDSNKVVFTYSIEVSSQYGSDGDITLSDKLSNALDSKLGSNAIRTIENVKCSLRKSDWTTQDLTSQNYVSGAVGNVGNGDTAVSGTLPELAAGDTYVITYDVVISDIPDGIGSLEINNKNSVAVSDSTNTDDDVSDNSVWYNSGSPLPTISKEGVLSADENTITWTITINIDKKKDLTGVAVSDILKKNNVELSDTKMCDVAVNDVASGSKITLPASFVLEGDTLYLSDGANKIEVTDNKSKVVLVYTTDSSDKGALGDTYYNEVTVGKDGRTEKADATVVIEADVIEKTFVHSVENESDYTLSWKSRIYGISKLSAGDTYADKVAVSDGEKPRHYFLVSQIDSLVVGGLTKGVDYKVSYIYADYSNTYYHPEQETEDSSTIPTGENVFITGYKVTFLKDVVSSGSDPLNLDVTYDTTVSSETQYTATNTGTLTVNGSSKSDSDSTTVSGITNGKVLGKYSYTNGSDEKNSIVGYDKAGNVFIYKLVINEDFAFGNGDTVSIVDTLPEGTEFDSTYFDTHSAPVTGGERCNGMFITTYYAGNKNTAQSGASNFIENFSYTGNKLSFTFNNLYFWSDNVKLEIYYAVKATEDLSQVVGGTDKVFENNCTATVTRSNGSTKIGTDSASVTVTGPNISKSAGVYNDDTNSIEYTVHINEKGEALGTTGFITVVDKYDYSGASSVKNVFIKDGSLKLYYTETGDEVPSSLYSYTYIDDTASKLSTLTLTMPDEVKLTLVYTYTLVYTGRLTATVKNSVGILGSTSSADSSSTNTSIKDQDSSMGTDTKQYNLSIIKTDAIMTGIKLAGAKFALYRYGDPMDPGNTEWQLMVPGANEERVTNDEGRLDLLSLYYNFYYKLVEVEAPEGYAKLTNPIYIYKSNITSSIKGNKPSEISSGDVSDIVLVESGTHDYTLPVSNKPENRKITVKKAWKDAEGNALKDIPVDSITVNIYASTNPSSYDKTTDKLVKTVVLGKDNNWTSDELTLDVADAENNYLYYFVEEDFSDADYTTTISGNGIVNGVITVTNKNTKVVESKIDIPVEKVWSDSDNAAGVRPDSITVSLAIIGSDNSVTKVSGKELVLNSTNNWSGTFTDLDKKDADGNIINYTVVESAVANYTGEVTLTKNEEGVVTAAKVTNTVKTGKLQITKLFAGDMNDTLLTAEQKQAITFTVSGPAEYTGKTTFTYDEFTAGSIIIDNAPLGTYTVTETGAAIDGYEYTVTYKVGTSTSAADATTSVEADKTALVTVINRYTALVSVSGTKTWSDSNDNDGIRPTSIVVRLYENGVKKDYRTVTAADNWKYSFTALPKFDAEGNEIVYTVKEDPIDGYTASYSGYNITNAHTPETVEVSGTKTWDDAENQDNKRPDSIVVNLYANTVMMDSKTVTASDNWQYSFKNLPKYEAGKEIEYSITENTVPEYTTDIEGYNIKNRYSPKKTSVQVVKTWDDKDNQDGKRPASVKVQLLADGTPVADSEVTLEEANNWTHTWTGLDINKSGNKIAYTVKETGSVSPYTSVVTGSMSTGFTVTNSYTPETTSISGSKLWNDSDNQDGKRPSSITVNLLKNGTKIDSKTVTAADDWKFEFDNLPKYEAGTLITYSIAESTTETYAQYYTSSVSVGTNGEYLITNTYTPEKTSVSGTKVWDDGNNQDGKRPSEITVNLLADGVKVDSKNVKDTDNWQFTFDNLPKYKNGVQIVYTVTENPVKDYTTSVDGYTITNKYEPLKTNISVSKIWDDADNQDGKRPASVKAALYADTVLVAGSEVTLNEDNSWKYTWKDLPKMKNGNVIEYSVKETSVDTAYTPSVTGDMANGFVITNSYTPETTSVSGTKVWDDGKNQDGKRPSSITVKLLADNVAVDSKVVTEADNWSFSFTNLPKYKNGNAIVYTVSEEAIKYYSADISGTAADGFTITNKYSPAETSVSVVKVWDDTNNQDGIRPDSVKVLLLADGTPVADSEVTLDAANNWSHTWSKLAKMNNGTEIVYSVEETSSAAGYTDAVSGNMTDGFTVTNTHVPETVRVGITKLWDDANNQDGIRPDSVTINLLADDVLVDSKNVSEADNWSASFDNLPKYKAGKAIVYTVTENPVAGYTCDVTGSVAGGFKVTNKHITEKTSVSGNKVWDDSNNQDNVRPSYITVYLFADGVKIDSKKVTEADGWLFTFDNLPKYNNGNLIVYTVLEDSVNNYSTDIRKAVDGTFTITNSYTPGKTSISVVKEWDDADNQDGKRPTSVTVQLLSDGIPVTGSEVTLDAANNWTYTWTELDVNKSGNKITYTVEETGTISPYTSNVTGSMSAGYTITNSYVPETTQIAGVKSWDDAGNQDGKRPSDITVNLLADGKKVDSVTVTEADAWSFSFNRLPKYKNGNIIKYSVSEEAVSEYTTDISGNAADGFTIKNSHTPEKTSVSGKKIWDDANNQDRKRPDSITVNLLADGVKVDSVSVSAADNWSFVFDNLDKYNNGQLIAYTVSEESILEYTADIKGDVSTGFTITNSYAPGKTSVSVTKVWNDAGNQDGLRPNSVKAELYADGVVVANSEITLDASNSWSYTWSDLDEMKDGQTIKYTVKETTVVSKYDSEVTGNMADGFVITNRHTPERTQISGSKVWNDANNQDNKRPSLITVLLFADGVMVDSRTVTAADGWKFKFTNLDKYNNGKLIVYTIKEANVADYTADITVNANSEYTITNTYLPGKTSVSVMKSWDDANNQDGKRPKSIKVTLLADGVDVDNSEIELNAANQWSYTWTDLDEMKSGVAIKYSVKESGIPKDYTSLVTGNMTDGFVITNKHEPEVVSVSGSKIWNDANNQDNKRPDSITVNLLADGVAAGSAIVTAADGWVYTFSNLPKYKNGVEIKYTVSEEPVNEYQTDIEDYTITNTYTPGKTSVSVLKVWDDDGNNDGKRPSSITVDLYADGVLVGGSRATLSEANSWYHEWKNLDKMKAGKDIVYTVAESDSISGYSAVITGSQSQGFVITNTHENEKVSVSGEKTWVDEDNKDNVRPDSITVNLLADGVIVDRVIVTSADDWKYSFKNLDKYSNGKAIKYTISEEAVAGYVTAIDGYDITNTYIFGNIRFIKHGYYKESCADNSEETIPLSGVEFTLYKASDKAFAHPVAKAKSVKGIVTFDKLPIGKYVVKETKTVGSYIPSDEVYTVDVTEESASTYAKLNKVKNNTIINDMPRSDIKLLKVSEEDNDVTLPDSVYGLFKMDQNGKEVLVAKKKTDKNGVLEFDGIFLDTEYTIKELQAPDGCYVSESPISISFTKNENGDVIVASFDGGFNTESGQVTATVDENGNITWLEPSVRYSFEKIDEDGSPVKGATLRIMSEDGDVIDEWITDGKLHEVNRVLVVGKTYILRETKAPKGYELAEDITFTVSDDKVAAGEDIVVTITMIDEKSTTETTTEITTENTTEGEGYPVTGDDIPVVPIAIAFVLCLGGCGFIVIYKKRRDREQSN